MIRIGNKYLKKWISLKHVVPPTIERQCIEVLQYSHMVFKKRHHMDCFVYEMLGYRAKTTKYIRCANVFLPRDYPAGTKWRWVKVLTSCDAMWLQTKIATDFESQKSAINA